MGPQCDTDGYQMGVCNDLCLQVEDVCGPFIGVTDASGNEGAAIAFDCNSPRYQAGSTGSCYNNLPVTVPPTVVNPLDFFNDDDDDDGVGLKMFERSVVEDSSSASSLSFCFVL